MHRPIRLRFKQGPAAGWHFVRIANLHPIRYLYFDLVRSEDGPGWKVEAALTDRSYSPHGENAVPNVNQREARRFLEEAGIDTSEFKTLRNLKATLEECARNARLYGVGRPSR